MTPHTSAPADAATGEFTVGVEEEYFVVDRETSAPAPKGELVVRRAAAALGGKVHTELQQAQLEVSTDVCCTLSEVRDELRRLRREVSSAAAAEGADIAATGTHPLASWREHAHVTPTETYLRIERSCRTWWAPPWPVARGPLASGPPTSGGAGWRTWSRPSWTRRWPSDAGPEDQPPGRRPYTA